MTLFEAFDQDVEVNGETVLAIVDGMGILKDRAIGFLEENGIKDPQKGKWYSQQAWLNTFRSISKRVGDKTLEMIGMKIPENANWIEGIDSIHSALESIDKAYHLNHRGGEIGNYGFEKTSDRSAKMVCTNPYPDHFDLGIIKATANKFAPEGTVVDVMIDKSSEIRGEGGNSTTYIITW